MTGKWKTLFGGVLLVAIAGSDAASKETAVPAAPFLFTPLNERGVSFTRDGNTAYFLIRVDDGAMQVLCVAERHAGKWSEPKVLPFSGKHLDADPFVTPDGSALYFASNRTMDDQEKPELDIWVVENKGGVWGEPHPVGGKINGPANERSPVLTKSGRLYFVSTRSGGGDIFYSQRGPDGTFGEPVALGPEINSSSPEAQVAISPDEKTLVFTAFRPDEALVPGGHPYVRGDLYVSYFKDRKWTEARRLGDDINTVTAEASPSFSPDGRYFYFMSERGFAMRQDVFLTYDALERGVHSVLNGRGNVYRIPATALRDTP